MDVNELKVEKKRAEEIVGSNVNDLQFHTYIHVSMDAPFSASLCVNGSTSKFLMSCNFTYSAWNPNHLEKTLDKAQRNSGSLRVFSSSFHKSFRQEVSSKESIQRRTIQASQSISCQPEPHCPEQHIALSSNLLLSLSLSFY